MIILLTAIKHDSCTEFIIHKNEAINAGLEIEIINLIENNNNKMLFDLIKNKYSELLSIYIFAQEILNTSTCSKDIYHKVRNDLGDKKMVELVSIIGYYTFVAITLNTFNIKP